MTEAVMDRPRLDAEQQQLITIGHVTAAANVAKRFARSWRLDRDDCISVAHEALCRAAIDFDPTLGVKFETLAIRYQQEALRDYRTRGSKPAGLRGRKKEYQAPEQLKDSDVRSLEGKQEKRRNAEDVIHCVHQVMSVPVSPAAEAVMVGILATGESAGAVGQLIGMPTRQHGPNYLRSAKRRIKSALGNMMEEL